MKKLMLAVSAIATLAATPALADGNNRGLDKEEFTLRANNPAKCNLSAEDYTLRLQNNSLTNNQGVARNNIGATVAAALTDAGVTAWCTGNSNKLQMYRTAFVANGTDGKQLDSGFNQAVIYDVALTIDGATRHDGTDPLEGTSDGQSNGPGLGVGSTTSLSRFGATAAGAQVEFFQEANQVSSAVSNASAGVTDATSSFTTDQNRLIAGQYTSILTIELTPGV